MDLWIFVYILMFIVPILSVLTSLIIPPLRTWWGMLGLGVFYTWLLVTLAQSWGWV